jgi:hypothetical protein
MIKDAKRRRVVKEFADERLRIQTIRKNKILPLEIRVSLIAIAINATAV